MRGDSTRVQDGLGKEAIERAMGPDTEGPNLCVRLQGAVSHERRGAL